MRIKSSLPLKNCTKRTPTALGVLYFPGTSQLQFLLSMYQLQTRTDLPRKLPCPYSPCFKLSLFICLQIVETKNPRAPGSTETRQMLAGLGKATCCGAQAKLVELKPASHPLGLSKAHSPRALSPPCVLYGTERDPLPPATHP